MNYDTQQYAFSHGLATAPQLHVQQQQHHMQQHQLQQHQFQQHQHIYQPQYNHPIPTSNIYQFQFAGGGNQMFQQKETHHMGLAGSVQQHGMVQQSFIKQGMPLGGMEGIHVVNGLDGMLYSHPKNSLKIIANPDSRMMQQTDTIGMQQAIVGVEMMGNSNFIDQNVEVQQQGAGIAGQGNMFTYNNKHFTGWLQPQNINAANSDQCQAVNQSSLPSFNHLWSQFQHQKQVGVVQQHQHINHYQQPQQFHQQSIQTQQFTTGANFQTLPGIQMVKMQQQKAHQISVPVSMQSLLPSQFQCFSPSSHVNLISSKCLDKEPEVAHLSADNKGVHISAYPAPSISISQPISSPLLEHKCTTAVTYTISGPPKVTVTLDSLTHCETFPPNGLLEKSTEMSFNPDIVSNNFVSKGKSLKVSDAPENRHWQPVAHQRNQYVPKPLFHTSSTGSSIERSSSESSNFSSPPYTFTPPSSTDSLFSPVSTLFPSPKPTAITSSPPTTQYLAPSLTSAAAQSNEAHHDGATMTAVTVLSLASTCTTTVTTTVASSYHSVALTTTFVTSTTPCPRESMGIASVHSGSITSSNANLKSEHNRPCSPAQNKGLTKKGREKKVKVPYSWHRNLQNGIIQYLSPSGVTLQSLEQIYAYLLSDTTCKCGLQCPLHVDTSFSFDPDVGSEPWNSTSANGEDLGTLCNHTREIIALAAFRNSQAEVADKSSDSIVLGKKRLDKKSLSAGDELIVSPLKRLKSSITKAVNKHATILGTTSQPYISSQDSLMNEDSILGNTDKQFSNRVTSPFTAPGGNGNAPSNFSSHVGLSSAFNRGLVRDTDQSIVGSCERKQAFHLEHQGSLQASSPPENSSYVPYEQRSGSERMAAIDKARIQGEHHSSRGKSFYQSHMYTPQTSEGYLQSMWQNTSPTRTSISQFQSSPQPTYQSSAGFNQANYIHPQGTDYIKHSTPQQELGRHAWLDPKKTAKSKRPKSKKQKQMNSPACIKSTKAAQNAVSFFENPTVFVEQQTAMINNSIASCQISCTSPTPLRSEPTRQITTLLSRSDIGKSVKKCLVLKSEEIELDIKSDCDSQKSVLDLDSSKSFSDDVENNDSAYLSQVGSSQDRSDSDTCADSKNRSCDIYDFTISEDKNSKNVTVTAADTPISERSETDEDSPQFAVAQNKSLIVAAKGSEKKVSKLKPKVKPCQVKKEEKFEGEIMKNLTAPKLNGDVTQILACNNWNISALQQVLAQCNQSDKQLNAAIQQAVSQAASVGVEFPASSLLSAAARAQHSYQNRDHISVTMPSVVSVSGSQLTKNDVVPATCVSVHGSGGVKSAVATTACVTNPAISQLQQHQHQNSQCIQQLSNNTNLIGNMMQLQHLSSGNFTMNMLVPVCGQGQGFTSDTIHTATYASEHDHKTSLAGPGNINPMMAQGILATVSRSPELGSQLKLSVASVIPSSLGPQCSQDTMLLNSFSPRMIMNNAMPPVSVSVVTNVTKSLAQVVPAIGINQTVFNTQPVGPQLINPQQGGPQIINATAPGPHMLNASPQGAQVVGQAPQGNQLVNNTSQTTQIMNALSVQSLNNQLLITNPLQQVSPTNSISQLSPAMAAQILAQNQQHIPQMSPSFLQSQIQKQTLGTQNMFASVSLPTLTVTSDHSDVIVNTVSQSGIIGNFQNPTRSEEQLDKADITNMPQVKDTVSMANPLYASTSQPVFVIPQPNANPMMQVLGTSQQLGQASDLNNLTQIFSPSTTIDHNQLQNLMNAGFNPINVQQMMGTVNLSGVQQQQQLQMLQLQQLLLQQIQNQGQNIHGISLPLNSTTAPQTIMNAVVPPRGMHINSVMDINALHSSLSPVAQGYQNQLSPATAQIQHITPAALTVHQVTSVNTCGAVGVIHNSGVPGLMQASAKSLPSVVATVQSQQIASDQFPHNEHYLRVDSYQQLGQILS